MRNRNDSIDVWVTRQDFALDSIHCKIHSRSNALNRCSDSQQILGPRASIWISESFERVTFESCLRRGYIRRHRQGVERGRHRKGDAVFTYPGASPDCARGRANFVTVTDYWITCIKIE